MKLDGRCAIVTGAASGMGRATAQTLHDAGANVVLLDVTEEPLAKIAAELGDRAVAVRADVSAADEVENAVRTATEQFGTVHAAVNCAGIPSMMKTVAKGGVPHSLEVWQRVIDVNLTGVFNVVRLAAAQMVTNEPDPDTAERGVLVNIASGAAWDGTRGTVAYSASKAGVVGMSMPIARDLAKDGIRCVSVVPGIFETGMAGEVSETVLTSLQESVLFPQRMGDPPEIGRLIEHIITNAYFNATCISLDAGLRARH
ncbi:3-hydroxyacyl-CoA dehydrogenase [Mycolicibacterium chitae]|uniref:Short-chain dehydrogenase n=1 Tax=Mycolicibacterium chitae TaxID=1792 RepID=A0A3S4VC71_MYCCI|nr:SDR family NAD(P)-dependent oxidoreductase [Mycolicibacterium chitae]MCV7109198.1 SDR family NAD(P)-dependent oxidoreductase [Mycolicibacterium chitae]BBZ04816.1 3-hydroxyacyl-CoA dehydrogenase [Mycolicibacterium chitae]VEG48442.1 short-chain dehydrogenase [Mycolicibacterium chitae]